MTLEGIEVSGPELTEGRQPGVNLLKRFRPQAVETALCIHRGLHETGVSKNAQML
jgi:hypothetical protein